MREIESKLLMIQTKMNNLKTNQEKEYLQETKITNESPKKDHLIPLFMMEACRWNYVRSKLVNNFIDYKITCKNNGVRISATGENDYTKATK